ncbi:OPT oligopeptide transporter protein-domain-containing protein [Lipomyces doorenjongii]|uniref:OPT oligopeptide transporter protein-domain-containing protein n=1 Tax=Lipomyces doorenjongii TaxID=383834 RepID=UPI0034CE6BC9
MLSMFYGQTWINYGFIVLMCFCCQFFALGLAGVLRRWAFKAVWPTILPTLQLNRTLLLPDTKKKINNWTISKYKLFWIVMWGTLVYFFIPDYLFTSLSSFNWMTEIAPQNKHLAFITGSYIGLGVNPISTFDWSVVGGSAPLVVPFYTVANRYYSFVDYSAYMPPNTSNVYDRFRKAYNVSKVLVDGKFNEEMYRSYSPPYISAGQLMYQGASYAVYTFGFAYVFLSEWRTVKEAVVGFYRSLKDPKVSNYESYKDFISVMMREYKEVPDWWFLIILAISVIVSCLAMKYYPTTTSRFNAIHCFESCTTGIRL